MSDLRTDREIMISAGRALGKVDLYGPRGLTMISSDELEAMAITLVIFGLVAIPPGTQVPETLIFHPKTEA